MTRRLSRLLKLDEIEWAYAITDTPGAVIPLAARPHLWVVTDRQGRCLAHVVDPSVPACDCRAFRLNMARWDLPACKHLHALAVYLARHE
jgi:hypothetical protein